jgi:hypothetical protein
MHQEFTCYDRPPILKFSTSGVPQLMEYVLQRAFDAILPAATTERPVPTWERRTIKTAEPFKEFRR